MVSEMNDESMMKCENLYEHQNLCAEPASKIENLKQNKNLRFCTSHLLKRWIADLLAGLPNLLGLAPYVASSPLPTSSRKLSKHSLDSVSNTIIYNKVIQFFPAW